MDASRFDALTRGLSAALTRRRGLALVLGGLAAAGQVNDGDARRATCRAAGTGCTRNSQCCNNVCNLGRQMPRSKRNRCCSADCTGKICGNDGCGGTCGAGCEAGLVCNDDGTACVSPCEGFDTSGGLLCSGTIEGEAVSATDWMYPSGGECWDSGDSEDCQGLGACAVDGWACVCQSSWLHTGTEVRFADPGNNSCRLYATETVDCAAVLDEGYTQCAVTTEGDVFGHYGSMVMSGFGICSSDAECVARDVRCNNADSSCHCVMAQAGTEAPPPAPGFSYIKVQAGCMRVSHVPLT